MQVIPAIDIKEGKVVRLREGRFDEKLYSEDPLKVANMWQDEGAEFIHVVDLDGAVRGEPVNLKLIARIARGINIPIEFGGGIRDIELIREVLSQGIKRVVLGTKAIEDDTFLKQAIKEFQDKIAVSLDERRGKAVTFAWRSRSRKDTLILAEHLQDSGVKTIIYTDTLRDGTLQGPNIERVELLLRSLKIPLIASGGISSLDDLKRLKSLGVAAAIVGKALYERRFKLSEAIKICRQIQKEE